ncbi:LysR family transcriptional regulator [Pseudomonas sp. StFLB209]|uniref:LysR family transcriptional regulator n=1 Tax=Pseudomonas sp. StFLB209 TaxID=1028989 RepID=UPI0005EF55E6|nr:LysR family transcriptional regulator [Pseudomonas sp. StFLB209]
MSDLRTLKDFLVLARILSFSQAAERCNVTTSGLSRRINSLEEWLGAPVFDRSRHRLELTDAGEQLQAAALDAVALLDNAKAAVARAREHKRLHISLAAPHIMSRAFFPDWLPRVRNQSSATRFSIDFANLPGCFRALSDRKADFVVAFSDEGNGIRDCLSGAVDFQQFDILTLGHERLVPVSAPDMLGAALNSLEPASGEVSYLRYQPECSLGWALERKLDIAKNLPVLTAIHDSSLADGLHSMALMGLGVAWLPWAIVIQDMERKRLVRAGGEEHDITLSIELIRLKQPLETQAEKFWQHLCEMDPSIKKSRQVLREAVHRSAVSV